MNKVFKVDFKDCTGLETGYAKGVEIAKKKPYIDTSSSSFSMKYFFADNARSSSILQYISTETVMNWQQCFYRNTAWETIDIPTPQARWIGSYCYQCTSVKEVANLYTGNAVNVDFMFYGCTNLETVCELDLSKGESYSNMFYNCSKLKNITFTQGSIMRSINFLQSPELTLESAISIILGLYVYTPGENNYHRFTVTFAPETIALLESQGVVPEYALTWLEIIDASGWNY